MLPRPYVWRVARKSSDTMPFGERGTNGYRRNRMQAGRPGVARLSWTWLLACHHIGRLCRLGALRVMLWKHSGRGPSVPSDVRPGHVCRVSRAAPRLPGRARVAVARNFPDERGDCRGKYMLRLVHPPVPSGGMGGMPELSVLRRRGDVPACSMVLLACTHLLATRSATLYRRARQKLPVHGGCIPARHRLSYVAGRRVSHARVLPHPRCYGGTRPCTDVSR